MALENLVGADKFIANLVVTNPTGGDDKREGDEHIRGLKNVLVNTFPAINGAVQSSDEDLNMVLGGYVKLPGFGTAAAPGYSFYQRPNQGMYSASTTQLAFSVGGADRLLINTTSLWDAISNNELGWRDTPLVTGNASYLAGNIDRGKCVVMSGTNPVFTIPQAGAGPALGMLQGCVVSVLNTSVNPCSLARNGATTAILWNGVEGNRTLAQWGLARFMLVGAATWILTGAGIT